MSTVSVVLPVLAPTPFLRAMTEFAIRALRHHADNDFELVVVEATDTYFDPRPRSSGDLEDRTIRGLRIDNYLNFNPKIGGVREINRGIQVCSGEFIVTTGNDVIVPQHWDTQLLRCFEERKDCGLAALSACEPGAVIGPTQPLDMIVEGMYSPFNMFRKGWEYDESYIRVYQDSDLVMRMYEAGLRSYRSCRAHVHHLLRMTNDSVDTAAHNEQLGKDEQLFYARWSKSPLAAFAMMRVGQYRYGNEHESWQLKINLQHDPNKVA